MNRRTVSTISQDGQSFDVQERRRANRNARCIGLPAQEIKGPSAHTSLEVYTYFTRKAGKEIVEQSGMVLSCTRRPGRYLTHFFRAVEKLSKIEDDISESVWCAARELETAMERLTTGVGSSTSYRDYEAALRSWQRRMKWASILAQVNRPIWRHVQQTIEHTRRCGPHYHDLPASVLGPTLHKRLCRLNYEHPGDCAISCTRSSSDDRILSIPFRTTQEGDEPGKVIQASKKGVSIYVYPGAFVQIRTAVVVRVVRPGPARMIQISRRKFVSTPTIRPQDSRCTWI